MHALLSRELSDVCRRDDPAWFEIGRAGASLSITAGLSNNAMPEALQARFCSELDKIAAAWP
jgi:hypothetical protein